MVLGREYIHKSVCYSHAARTSAAKWSVWPASRNAQQWQLPVSDSAGRNAAATEGVRGKPSVGAFYGL